MPPVISSNRVVWPAPLVPITPKIAGPPGITVTGATPSVVRGDMGAHGLADAEVRERLLQRIPLGRVAEPQDVAGPVQLFCSPAAAFVTGQILYVDGGLTAAR